MARMIDKDLYLSVIKKVVNKELTQKDAALKLEISDRQIRRLVVSFKNDGEKAFIHKNIANTHAKRIPDSLVSEIVNIYLDKYSYFGFTHFYEEQGYKYGISFQSMINIFKANDIVSPYAQHKTLKLYNENMKNAIRENTIKEEQKKLFDERKKEELEKHIRRSNVNFSFGEEIQMDAAFWNWFGDDESALHLAVDKATKKVLAGCFDSEETTEAYLTVLMDMVKNYGIPQKIKTDKRNSFSINNAKSSKTRLNITQFGRICEDLKIELSCNSNPLFKPNVERENGTVKRRLKAELKVHNITNKDEATIYLNKVFIPKLNQMFSYKIDPKRNVMRENYYTEKELNFIISLRCERTIDNASSIKYYYNYYLPINEETGEVVSFKSGTKCTIVKTYDNKLLGIIEEKTYELLLVEQQENKSIKASTHGYTPSSNNPWRKNMMLR